MSAPLKPCPFCGGDVIRGGHIRDGRLIGCVKCGAVVSKFNPNAEDRSIAAWNTRAAAPELVALVEAVEDAIACGMIPKSSAAEGGANKYSEQVRIADKLRAALAAYEGMEK